MAVLEQELTSPSDRATEWTPSELRRIVIRLTDGDLVQAGTAPNLDGAMALARSLVAEIDSPIGDWPRIGDRMLRPNAVVSVDVLRINP